MAVMNQVARVMIRPSGHVKMAPVYHSHLDVMDSLNAKISLMNSTVPGAVKVTSGAVITRVYNRKWFVMT